MDGQPTLKFTTQTICTRSSLLQLEERLPDSQRGLQLVRCQPGNCIRDADCGYGHHPLADAEVLKRTAMDDAVTTDQPKKRRQARATFSALLAEVVVMCE